MRAARSHTRPDPTAAAQALVAALPALIDQAEAAGGPLKLAADGMRTALAEARRVVDDVDRPQAITSVGKLLRRLGG